VLLKKARKSQRTWEVKALYLWHIPCFKEAKSAACQTDGR
jgi:hypothetical protein